MEKITQLTPEQEKLMEVVRDEWIELAIGGDSSIDAAAVDEGIEWMYGLANLSKPEIQICASPYEAVMAARARGAKDVYNTNYMGLGYWSGWSAWCDFYRRIGVPGVVDLEPLAKWLKFVRAGVWDVLLFEEIAYVCRRPNLVARDETGRLHSPNGPAVRFEDNFAVYSWRGTTVPAEWIEKKDTIDPQLALTHQNIEQRRALAEILGWEKVLAKLPNKIIDEDPDPEIGTLLEVELPGTGPAKFLRVMCGTKRQFVLPMPREITTARQGNSWSYGLDIADFNVEVRT